MTLTRQSKSDLYFEREFQKFFTEERNEKVEPCFVDVCVDGFIELGTKQKPKTLDELACYTGPTAIRFFSKAPRPKARSSGIPRCPVFIASWWKRSKGNIPDIAIEVYRGGSTDLGPRFFNEAQAGRFVADALESTPELLMLLRERNILKPYVSPELSRYPDEAKTKSDGARVFWVTDREAYLGFGYNTKMIPQQTCRRASRIFCGRSSKANW